MMKESPITLAKDTAFAVGRYQGSSLRFDMRKKMNIDPLISQIELVLDLGQFISYNQSWDFVHDLEDIKNKIDDLIESGEASRAVRLYEMFLSPGVMKRQKKSTIQVVISECFFRICSYPGSTPDKRRDATKCGYPSLTAFAKIIPENTVSLEILRKL